MEHPGNLEKYPSWGLMALPGHLYPKFKTQDSQKAPQDLFANCHFQKIRKVFIFTTCWTSGKRFSGLVGKEIPKPTERLIFLAKQRVKIETNFQMTRHSAAICDNSITVVIGPAWIGDPTPPSSSMGPIQLQRDTRSTVAEPRCP